MSLFDKLKEITSKWSAQEQVQTQEPIEYNFDYTGYEDLSNENLTKMFRIETFVEMEQSEQAKIVQEQVNRMTKELKLREPMHVIVTQQTQNNIDIEGNLIKIDPGALGTTVRLYVELAGAMERTRQVELAKTDPTHPISIQINNQAVQLRTGFSYDHTNITPMIGSGSMRFPPTINTSMTKSIVQWQSEREGAKQFSHDYYISRFQPTEREVAKAMEKAWRDIKLRMDEDKILEGPSRLNLNYTREVIGNYQDDLNEYIARTSIADPEREIDRFLTTMASGSKKPFLGITDIIDTDIKIASIHAYNIQHNIPLRLADDPRIMQQCKHNASEFSRMSNRELRRFFYPINWNQLSLTEKKMLLQEQCNREAKELGLTRNYTVIFENIHDGSGAYYRPGEDKVHFNLSQVNSANPLSLYTFIPHELTHAKQNEIAMGFIKTTLEEQMFNAHYWRAGNILTTPNEYHGIPLIPINGQNLDQSGRSQFVFMDAHEVASFPQRRIQEAQYLYRLQPIERAAYEYQEHKQNELKQQMEEEGKLTKFDRTVLEADKQYSIANIERYVIDTYGCPNPTEAIKQFQSFVSGLALDYDPQTAEFDFALRFQAMSLSVYNKSKVYITDPRDEILKQHPERDITATTPRVVEGRMSNPTQWNPPVYTEPLSDEVKKSTLEINNDDLAKGLTTTEDKSEGKFEDPEKTLDFDSNNKNGNAKDEELTQGDKQFILNALGEPPEDEFIQTNNDIMSANANIDEEDLDL